MEWKPLTEDDALSAMTKKERDDFATTSVDNASVSDRLQPILDDLVAEIRGYISTWSPNTLSADATLIPPGFKSNALAIARWRLLTTIPGYSPGSSREKDYDNAVSFFKQVAAGTIRPQPADDAEANDTPSENPSGVQIINSPGSRTGRDRMNGI